MNMVSLIEVAGLIMAAVVAISWIDRKGKERREQLRVIEEELKNPSLTAPQRDALHDQLLGDEARKEKARQQQIREGSSNVGSQAARVAFAFGWLGLFTAGGLAIAGEMNRDDEFWTAGFIVGCCSLALITLPIAIREFDRAGERKAPRTGGNAGGRV